jgi:predicted transcriptional regulator
MQNHLLNQLHFLVTVKLSIQQLCLLICLHAESSLTLAEIDKKAIYSHKSFLYATLKRLQGRKLIGKSGLKYFLIGKGELAVVSYLSFYNNI